MPTRTFHSTVDAAVSAAAAAQSQFAQQGLHTRRAVIAALRRVSNEHAGRWAGLAVAETGMGRPEDKARKNRLCADRTPGTEDLVSHAYTGDKGLTLVEYAPFGVVAAVTPSNNPAATIISNAIAILAAGNGVVFAPHPGAVKVCQDAMAILSAAAADAGAPPGIIATVSLPSHAVTRELLSHPGVQLNLVTGGHAIVREAFATGKIRKTIAAGPGNPPVVIDETAVFPDCVQDLIFGASFDNNILCISEKEAIITEAARAPFFRCMRADPRAYELSAAQLDKLAGLVLVPGPSGGDGPGLVRDYVGRDASVLAGAIGIEVPAATRLLWAEAPPTHPFVWVEQLMPVLPVTVVPDIGAAVDLAARAESGHHHTASMYSTNVANMTLMGRRLQCSIFVKNAPTLYGLGLGEGYASMSIGTPTGDGITKPSHFVRPLHCCLVGYFRIV